MRELLIRYLLGELEPEEHDAVQQQLAENPELRRELARLRSCFASSLHTDESANEPPRGLAERTAVRVSESGEHNLPPRESPCRDAADPPAGALGWNLADLVVAGGVILAVSMLLFPALRESRDGTRRNVCANNQYQLWRVIRTYADDHGGYVPPVQPNENAGIFAVRLVELNYISADDLAHLLVCPGSPTAHAIRAGEKAVVIPTPQQLAQMTPAELQAARRKMSPSYAYCFGFRVGQQYYYIKDGLMPIPILSDAPGGEADDLMSPNHAGSVVQVLNIDGNVKALTSCKVQGGADDLFLNAAGEMEAGYGRQDAVLGSSEATPGVFVNALGRPPVPVWQQRPFHDGDRPLHGGN